MLCPECAQGKHVNCTREAINDADEIVPCECPATASPDGNGGEVWT